MGKREDELRVLFIKGMNEPMSRRGFLRRAGTTGLVLAGAGWLAGCGDDGGGSGDTEMSDQLNIYNWSDYIAEDTIPNFEEEFGVSVTYDNYSSNDTLLAKLQSGATGYDIIVPSDYMVTTMRQLDLLQPINLDNVPNIENLYPRFREAPFDPGNEYSIPWQWGTTGIGYNMEQVPDFRPSWEMMWDEKYSGKITMLTEIRDVFAVALFRLGYDINTTDAAQINEAKDMLLEQKPLLKHYTSDTYIDELASNDTWLAHGYSGDVFQAVAENESVGYAIPEEGAVIWVDSMCIPKDAPHKYTAEAFMNYVLQPEVGAAISNYVWYASPNQAAEEFIDPEILQDPAIYPPEEVEARLQFIEDLGDATTLYNDAFAELRAT